MTKILVVVEPGHVPEIVADLRRKLPDTEIAQNSLPHDDDGISVWDASHRGIPWEEEFDSKIAVGTFQSGEHKAEHEFAIPGAADKIVDLYTQATPVEEEEGSGEN